MADLALACLVASLVGLALVVVADPLALVGLA